MLNLPNAIVNEHIKPKNVLLAAVGGGFDVFNAMTLDFTLACHGIHRHISSYSVDVGFKESQFVPITGVGEKDVYNPEGILASWLNRGPGLYDRRPKPNPPIPIYKIGKVGPRPLREAYKKLIDKLEIDMIIMMDGGVDSLMIGNEVRKGTVAEEYVNFAALSEIDIKKVLMSFGFGCEQEEQISHGRVLENMAKLFEQNKVLGACALTRDEADFANYNCSYQYVVDHFPDHKKSHIHPRIIRSIQGDFGWNEFGEKTIMKSNKPVFLSPLMAIMWFFDGDAVIRNNLLVPAMKDYDTFYDALGLVQSAANVRDHQPIPY
jgi:hypothetical protein